MIIRPGYDFTVNEIPNTVTMHLQVTGLTVTDLDTTRLDSDVLARSVVISDTSNATNASSEGALWVDAQGNLWGKNRYGLIQVRRHLGGWETNRTVYSFPGTGPAIVPAGLPVEPSPFGSSGTHLTAAINVRRMIQNRLCIGYLAETCQSGFPQTRNRVVCRGINYMHYRYTDGISSDVTAGRWSAWYVPTDYSSPWQTMSQRYSLGIHPGNVVGWRPELAAEVFSRLEGTNGPPYSDSGMTNGWAVQFPVILRSSQ